MTDDRWKDDLNRSWMNDDRWQKFEDHIVVVVFADFMVENVGPERESPTGPPQNADIATLSIDMKSIFGDLWFVWGCWMT